MVGGDPGHVYSHHVGEEGFLRAVRKEEARSSQEPERVRPSERASEPQSGGSSGGRRTTEGAQRNGEQDLQRHGEGDEDSDAEPSDDTLDRRTRRERGKTLHVQGSGVPTPRREG